MTLELGLLLLVAHSLAHMGGIMIVDRRILLETGCVASIRHVIASTADARVAGPAILLIHGLGGSWRYWRRGLDGLRTHHTLYLPDLIGFGRSPKPRGDYALPMHIQALSPLLEEADGPVTVVGHSMGAIVALGLYARLPERVKRVVLIGLPYFPSREAAEASLTTGGVMNRLVIARSWLAPAICYMKDVLDLPIFAPIAGMPVDLYRDYFKHTWASFSRTFFNTLLAPDVAGVFERVDRSRILLIHGRNDLTAPIGYVRELVQRFPDLALRELRGTHHLYLAYPRLVNGLIDDTSDDARTPAPSSLGSWN